MHLRNPTTCFAIGIAAAFAVGSAVPAAAETSNASATLGRSIADTTLPGDTTMRSDTSVRTDTSIRTDTSVRTTVPTYPQTDTTPQSDTTQTDTSAYPQRDTTTQTDTSTYRQSDTTQTDTSAYPQRDTTMQRDTTQQDTTMMRDTTMQRDTTMRTDTSAYPQHDTTGLPRDTTSGVTQNVSPSGDTLGTYGTSGYGRSSLFPAGFYVGVGGGASIPTGRFNDGYKTGWNITVPIGWRAQDLPWGIRLDLSYDRANGRDIAGFGGPGYSLSDVKFWSGMLDVTFHVPFGAAGRTGFYLMGGGGVHHLSDYGGINAGNTTLAPSTESTTRFGVNGGGGFTFGVAPSADIFVESRFVSVFTKNKNTNYVPVIAGIRFF